MVAVSSDKGKTWKKVNIPSQAGNRQIAYLNGAFVITSNDMTTGYYSVNKGETWIAASYPIAPGYLRSVNRSFLAFKYNTANAMHSKDGINWTAFSFPVVAGWMYSAYGNGVYVMASYNSNKILYSTNGDLSSWATAYLPASWIKRKAIIFDGESFCIFNNGSGSAACSTDGKE